MRALVPIFAAAALFACLPASPNFVAELATGHGHVCARMDDGSVRCWGANGFGQLGLGDDDQRGDAPGELGRALPAVDLGFNQRAIALDAGGDHSCVILDDGTVKCWGANHFGQLGVGDTAPRGDGGGELGGALPAVSFGRPAIALSAGSQYACVLLDDGSVHCWGENTFGELGIGSTSNLGDQADELGESRGAVDLGAGRAVAIAVGDHHGCAVMDDTLVKCWGINQDGTLGIGSDLDRGDDGGEMGESLPAADLGAGRTAVALYAGGHHTCALLDDASVKCWGNNAFGQLGLGDQLSRGDEPGEMGDSLPIVNLGSAALAVAVGSWSSCALLDDETVKCWGSNGSGALGVGDTEDRGDQTDEMGADLSAVDLGTGPPPRMLVGQAAGACVVLEDHSVKCWGWNSSGQLGVGDTDDRGDQPDEMGDVLLAVDLTR